MVRTWKQCGDPGGIQTIDAYLPASGLDICTDCNSVRDVVKQSQARQ